MNESDDLLVQSKFKNLRLWKLMDGKSGPKCARECGVSYNMFNRLLSLKTSPFSRRDFKSKNVYTYTESANSIADHYLVSPDYLFPVSLYSLNLPNVVEKSYSSPEILPLLAAGEMPALESPEKYAESSEIKTLLLSALHELTPRQERLIKLRYGFEDGVEHTLDEISEIFGVTRERVRQIEAKAIRRMGHPMRCGKYAVYGLDSDDFSKFKKEYLPSQSHISH